MPAIGVLFDIEGLGGGLYGYEAYKVFFTAVDTRQLPGCVLADGDTAATLTGSANHYCISVMSDSASALSYVRAAMTRATAPGLLPVERRFVESDAVRHEPLVPSAQIDAQGRLVNAKPRWVAEAWEKSPHTGPIEPVPAPAAPPPAPPSKPTASEWGRATASSTGAPRAAAPAARAVAFTDLFDRARFGLNLWIGVAIVALTVFENLLWLVPTMMGGVRVPFVGPAYFTIVMAFAVLEAVLFVWLVHAVRRPVPLVAWWAVIAVLRGVLWRGAFRLLPDAPWAQAPLLDAMALVRSIVFGAAFMGSLILAVRRWGVTLRAFLIGGVAASLVPALLVSWRAFVTPAGFRWEPLLMDTVNGLLLGGLLYAAIVYHLKRRGVSLANLRGGHTSSTTAAASPGGTTFYYICSGNASLIRTFAEVFKMAEQAGWGHAEQAQLSLGDGTLQAARRAASETNLAFDGDQYLGTTRVSVQRMDDLLDRLQAEGSEPLHVLAAQVVDAHASWVHTAYNAILEDAGKQGILPFRMYATKSVFAGRALAGLLREA